MDICVEKSGYLDLKVQGRGLSKRAWRNKFVTANTLTNHAEGRAVIRMQFHVNAASANLQRHATRRRGNIETLYLDNVTDVRRISTSRSHAHAFQVVEFGEEEDPVLVAAGDSETASQAWMGFLRAAFWPDTVIPPNVHAQIQGKGTFVVTMVDGEHAARLGLYGDYVLHVTAACLRLIAPRDGATRYEWRLRSLKRFAIVETQNDADINRLFVIFAGPSALKGAGDFRFMTCDAGRVLHCIHETINAAIASRDLNDSETERLERSQSEGPSQMAVPAHEQPRKSSLPASCEVFTVEDGTHNIQELSLTGHTHRDSHPTTYSVVPSPQTKRRQKIPGLSQCQEVNRSMSLSSTGSRDSGVALELASDSLVPMVSITDEANSCSYPEQHVSPWRCPTKGVDVRGSDGELHRSQSMYVKRHHGGVDTNADQRRFTCGEASGLRIEARKKKISDVYIDLDAILAAKATLDEKCGSFTEATLRSNSPPPVPPYPPRLKQFVRKSIQVPRSSSSLDVVEEAPTRGLVRQRKASRSRKLSVTSNVYFEVGSLSDLSKAGVEGVNDDGAESPSGKERKVSNLYLDLDTVAILRAESNRLEAALTPPEPPPRVPSPAQTLITPPEPPPRLPSPRLHPGRNSYPSCPSPQDNGRHRKNLACFLGSPSYPSVDVPPELPQRPSTLLPSARTRSHDPGAPSATMAPRTPAEQVTPTSGTVLSSLFGTLTRRKKKLGSVGSVPSTPPTPTRTPSPASSITRVQSITDWPLPTAQSKVSDNQLYSSPSTDEELDTIDFTEEVFSSHASSPPPPFTHLMSPTRISWHDGGNRGYKNLPVESSDSSSASEEGLYMPMSGVRNTNSVSKAVSVLTPTTALDSGEYEAVDPNSNISLTMSGVCDAVCTHNVNNTESTMTPTAEASGDEVVVPSDLVIQGENPYLLMSGDRHMDTQQPEHKERTESNLYMNLGQWRGSTEI